MSEEIVAKVKELWLESWREYYAKNPGSLKPETMVGQHSYVIEKTVAFTLEALKPKTVVPHMNPYLPRHEACGGQHAYGDCRLGKTLDTHV